MSSSQCRSFFIYRRVACVLVCVCVKLWINVLSFFGYKREQNRKQWKRRHTHTHIFVAEKEHDSPGMLKVIMGLCSLNFMRHFTAKETHTKKRVCRCSAVKRGSPPKIFDKKKENRRAKKTTTARGNNHFSYWLSDVVCEFVCVSYFGSCSTVCLRWGKGFYSSVKSDMAHSLFGLFLSVCWDFGNWIRVFVIIWCDWRTFRIGCQMSLNIHSIAPSRLLSLHVRAKQF